MSEEKPRDASGRGRGIVWTGPQRAGIELESCDVLVAAGAGTGKTTVLVERILRKLRDGSLDDLDDLLVVTFTEKAARQMKTRIYAALAADPGLRRHLPDVPRAHISTIHAFCSRLLRERFLHAEVEPAFRVLDEHARTEALEEALRQTFHRWYARNDEDGREFQRLVELAGFDERGEGLRLLVRRLHEFARATSDPDRYLDGIAGGSEPTGLGAVPWWGALEDSTRARWQEGLGLYEEMLARLRAGGYRPDAQAAIHRALSLLPDDVFRSDDARAGFLAGLSAAEHLKANEPPRIAWPSMVRGGGKNVAGAEELHDTAKTLLDSVVKLLGTAHSAVLAEEVRRRSAVRVLVELVREMESTYDAYKRRGGWLDFSDLEIKAARLLDRTEAAEAGERRYREVLVDEYQDVNGLQERILDAISRPGGRFRVGDVKQSIYGFRLADPTIFLGVLRKSDPLVPDGKDSPPRDGSVVVYMNENHRSRPGVLRFVNDVFSKVFDARTIGSDYGAQALAPVKEEAPGDCPVELHLIDIEAGRATPGLPSARQLALSDAWVDPGELQPRYVALRLRALSEDPLLRDAETGSCDWSKVAILLRSATRAASYRDALHREGIPAELGDGGSLFDEPIVRDLVSVLRTIDNPRDDVALAAAMRSPGSGFSSADLLRIRLAFPGASRYLDAVAGVGYGEEPALPDALLPPGEDFLLGAPDPAWEEIAPRSLRQRCRQFLERLVTWRLDEPWTGLERFVARVADELHLVSFAFAEGDGSRLRACLERFYVLARDYEVERSPSLHGFLARVDLLAEAGAVDTVPATRASGRGVRILTIHKSKGLEFPIVVVPQLDWRLSTRDRLASRIRIGREWVGLRWFDGETYTRRESLARQLLEWRQEETLLEEEARILYVAMTRAEEKLLLFGMQRGLPEAEPLSERQWSYLRRHAGSMLAWIMAVLRHRAREPVAPERLAAWGLAPDPVPTYGELQSRFDQGAQELGPDELEERPPGSSEHRSGDLHIFSVPKTLLAAALAERDAAPDASPTGIRGSAAGPATELDQAGEGEALRAGAVVARVLTRRPVPPVSRLASLRGKYWVTEFKTNADLERWTTLREEGTGFWPELATRLESPGGGDAGAASGRDMRTLGAEPGTPPIGIRSDAVGGAAFGAWIHDWIARVPFEELRPDRIVASLTRSAGERQRNPRIEDGLVQFVSSPWGERLRAAADRAEREVAFSLRWSVEELRRYLPVLNDEIAAEQDWTDEEWRVELEKHWVLLQGRLDCVFPHESGWVVLDWKTDRVTPLEVELRARLYHSQMTLYRQAVAALWGGPVTSVLVFLAAGEVSVEGPA